MAKRAALEKQRAAQGLGPEGQAAERTLQATAAEIEANKRCVIASSSCSSLVHVIQVIMTDTADMCKRFCVVYLCKQLELFNRTVTYHYHIQEC